MIELYTWGTPNGRKGAIMLEETGLPYAVHPINLGKNEQHDPAFLKLAPNNKIPAIIDTDGPGGPLSVFESGAILIYLAEKSGRLLAAKGPERYKALEWLNWQMGGIGPFFGQIGYFAIRSTEKSPLAIRRFTEEGQRLIGVIDRRLQANAYLAGENYSIPDIPHHPWTFSPTPFLKSVPHPTSEPPPAARPWLAAVGGRAGGKS